MDLLLAGELKYLWKKKTLTVPQAASIDAQRIGHSGVGASRCASASRGAPSALWRAG